MCEWPAHVCTPLHFCERQSSSCPRANGASCTSGELLRETPLAPEARTCTPTRNSICARRRHLRSHTKLHSSERLALALVPEKPLAQDAGTWLAHKAPLTRDAGTRVHARNSTRVRRRHWCLWAKLQSRKTQTLVCSYMKLHLHETQAIVLIHETPLG